MRRVVVGIVVAVVALSLAGCRKTAKPEREAAGPAATRPVEAAQGPSGTDYRAPSGEFIIQLPGAPEMLEEADGRTVYQLRTADYAYTVNKLACPTEFAGDADPTALYDKLRETIVAAVNGQAMSEYAVRAVGRTGIGREVVVNARTPRTGEPYEMVVRLFRDGNVVWLLQAIGPQAPQSRADRVGVLNTFMLLE